MPLNGSELSETYYRYTLCAAVCVHAVTENTIECEIPECIINYCSVLWTMETYSIWAKVSSLLDKTKRDENAWKVSCDRPYYCIDESSLSETSYWTRNKNVVRDLSLVLGWLRKSELHIWMWRAWLLIKYFKVKIIIKKWMDESFIRPETCIKKINTIHADFWVLIWILFKKILRYCNI